MCKIFKKNWKNNFASKFQNCCFEQWQQPHAKCLTFQDAYLEADNVHLGEYPATLSNATSLIYYQISEIVLLIYHL